MSGQHLLGALLAPTPPLLFLSGKRRASCGQPYLKWHLPAQRAWSHQVALGLPGLPQ